MIGEKYLFFIQDYIIIVYILLLLGTKYNTFSFYIYLKDIYNLLLKTISKFGTL